jgi:hypothetical protein
MPAPELFVLGIMPYAAAALFAGGALVSDLILPAINSIKVLAMQ